MRHGEKDAGGKLTDTGTYQAKLRGVSTKNLDGVVLLFHSGVGRVQDTVRTMAKHLHMSDKKKSFMNQDVILLTTLFRGFISW